MMLAAARSVAIGSVLALGACADAREPGREIVWESERVAPSGAPQAAAEDGCREYTQTVRIAGEERQIFGRACPQPDGSWRIAPPPAAVPQQRAPVTVTRVVPAYPYPYYAPYPYYYPRPYFGSAFFFSHRHHHHRHGHHHHRHWHRR